MSGRLGPGHDGQHQRQGEQVKQHQAQHRGFHRLLHGAFGVLGLASGHGNGLHAQVAEHGHDHAQPHAADALGPETAAHLVIGQPHAGGRGAKHHIAADQDEGDDGRHLDGRKRIFHRAIHLHAAQVHPHQHGREHAHPNPLRHSRKPIGHVNAHGRHLHAHGQHQRRPVGVAQHKADHGAQVVLGIRAKRARGGVGHRHLAQAADQEQGNKGPDGVAHQHRRPGKADGKGAAHEQAGADGAADGDHHHLGAGQMLLQAALALLNIVKTCHKEPKNWQVSLADCALGCVWAEKLCIQGVYASSARPCWRRTRLQASEPAANSRQGEGRHS